MSIMEAIRIMRVFYLQGKTLLKVDAVCSSGSSSSVCHSDCLSDMIQSVFYCTFGTFILVYRHFHTRAFHSLDVRVQDCFELNWFCAHKVVKIVLDIILMWAERNCDNAENFYR